jgi:uncharacterized membrane protein
MTTLSTWTFSTLQGADEAPAKLEKLNRDFPINLHDEAVVSWEAGRTTPKTVILPVSPFCESACEHALRP